MDTRPDLMSEKRVDYYLESWELILSTTKAVKYFGLIFEVPWQELLIAPKSLEGAESG